MADVFRKALCNVGQGGSDDSAYGVMRRTRALGPGFSSRRVGDGEHFQGQGGKLKIKKFYQEGGAGAKSWGFGG